MTSRPITTHPIYISSQEFFTPSDISPHYISSHQNVILLSVCIYFMLWILVEFNNCKSAGFEFKNPPNSILNFAFLQCPLNWLQLNLRGRSETNRFWWIQTNTSTSLSGAQWMVGTLGSVERRTQSTCRMKQLKDALLKFDKENLKTFMFGIIEN